MKFTLREMFLVTVIVALAIGWWGDRRLIIYRYDDYIRKNYNFKHMSIPQLGRLLEPASEDPTHHRFHTKEGYHPFPEYEK